MLEEALRYAEDHGRPLDARVGHGLRQRTAASSHPPVVLDAHDEAVRLGECDQVGADRLHPERVDDGHADPLRAQPLSHVETRRHHGADSDDQDVAVSRARHDVVRAHAFECLEVRLHRPLGHPQDGGCVVDIDSLAQLFAQPGTVAGGGEPEAGDHLQERHVPHAVV